MVSRSTSCADCGATVVATSAAPVVRAGAVVLLCGSCRGAPRPQPRPAPAPPPDEEEDDYADLVISAEPADEGDEYEDLSISPGEGDDHPGNVVYSEQTPSVSGDIDTDESDPP